MRMEFHFEHNALPGSLELAYLGDTLWDLFVREELVKTGGRMKELHRAAVARVRASAQSRALARSIAARCGWCAPKLRPGPLPGWSRC